MVPEVGLEPTSRKACDFESHVYTIPPLRPVCCLQAGDERIVRSGDIKINFEGSSDVLEYLHQMSQPYSNSIFWIEVEKIKPNPYQPRREFDEDKLKDLADSIRQYGILQPLVVTRREMELEGGMAVEYELIAGERRLRASKIAGLAQVPVLIRVGDDSKMKLELAIIENLQREDLNPVDRAKAFQKLAEEFGFKHAEIGAKVSKSREYVSNTLRLLSLPESILQSLSVGKISEGHARPLMMLVDRPEEQASLFNEIMMKKMTVREAEGVARRIAQDRVRKKERMFDPNIVSLENNLAETLGTRVQIEKKEVGGKITIDFFTDQDLEQIVNLIKSRKDATIAGAAAELGKATVDALKQATGMAEAPVAVATAETPVDDRSKEEVKKEEDEDIYNVKNFSV